MFRKSSNLEKALTHPQSIRSLNLAFPSYDLNNFKTEFSKFKHLRELSIHVDINYNNKIPNEIGELITLEKLILLNIPFQDFPNWILKLTNLKILLLRGNDIKIIPDQINELSNLKHLRIENTLIESIPDTVQSLSNLKSLSLGDNFELKKINPKILPPNLKWISLSPSGIPVDTIQKIKEEMPDLKLGKRWEW